MEYAHSNLEFFGVPANIHYPLGNEEDFGAIIRQRRDISEYEAGLSRLLYSNIRSGELFLDIGAQIGLFSVLAALNGARVISFEMRTSLVVAHFRTRNANGLHNWLPLNMAIDGNVGIIPYDDNAQFALVDGNAGARARNDTVLAIALDELPQFVAGGTGGCVKLDVEGFEIRALRGMKEYLSRSRPLACVECHPHPAYLYGTNIADIPSIFPQGYEFYVLADHREGSGVTLSRVSEVTPVADNFLLVCRPVERQMAGPLRF